MRISYEKWYFTFYSRYLKMAWRKTVGEGRGVVAKMAKYGDGTIGVSLRNGPMNFAIWVLYGTSPAGGVRFPRC